jgi:Transposase IS116/IS110/IS902 family
LSDLVRTLLSELYEELHELDRRITIYDRRIRELYRNSELCQRLGRIEGIGPVTATALIAAVGDRRCFKNGRQFAAWLGLVPKQRSSGGRARLVGISKRGDRYLRSLMIHGARAVLRRIGGKQDPRSLWLSRMRERRHTISWPSHSPIRTRASHGACCPQTCPTIRHGPPQLPEQEKFTSEKRRSHRSNCNDWHKMAKRSLRRFPNLICGPAEL